LLKSGMRDNSPKVATAMRCIFGNGLILSFVLSLTVSSRAIICGQTAAEMAQRGRDALKANHPEQAKDCFASAVRLSPKKSAYHAALADVDWALNDINSAISH